MNEQLRDLLRVNIGQPLTWDLAADIFVAAQGISTLIPAQNIARLSPEYRKNVVFAVEKMAEICEEVRPLHLSHWQETEGHRHDLPFNPDYDTFVRYEKAGRYILFTLRSEGRLMGNCAMYLDTSAHTQTLIATEDTLYLLPEARQGRTAIMFVKYVEDSLRMLGVKEIDITVKTVNKAGRFFLMLGYKHVENGLTKILETENVQQETTEA